MNGKKFDELVITGVLPLFPRTSRTRRKTRGKGKVTPASSKRLVGLLRAILHRLTPTRERL